MSRRRKSVWCLARASFSLLLGVLIGLAGAAVPVHGRLAGRAFAAEPSSLVKVTLTKVSPASPTRDDVVTLTGRVTNVSDKPLVRLQVLFWRSQTPITDIGGLENTLEAASDQPLGQRLFREVGAYQDLYTPDAQTLAPSASATFTVKAGAAALALPPTDGVYLMGVHVLQNGVPVAIGRARIFVPVVDHAPPASARVATLVAMTTQPSLLGPGLMNDDHIAREIAPNGRLRMLLEAAKRKHVSYAIDPALVDELETMRAGYLVRNSDDGSTRPGPGQADAAWWLRELTRLRSSHDGYRLLFAAPDVAALAHVQDTAALRAAAAAGRRNILTADLPLLILPTSGAADQATLKAAAALKPRAILLSDLTTEGAGPVLSTGTGIPLLSYIAGGLGGGPGPDPQNDAIHIRQRELSDSWVNLKGPKGQAAQIHLVQDKRDVVASSVAASRWSTPVPLHELLMQTAIRWSGVLSYPKSMRIAELSQDQMAESQHLSTAARTWADLLVEGTEAQASADAMTARSISGSWRGNQEASTGYVQPQQTSVDARLSRVQISTISRATTTAQEGISFPITVDNGLAPQSKGGDTDPMAVRVKLQFISENSARLKIETINANPVAPEGAYTANAKVTAKANGIVDVTAQLYTLHGYKIGRPAPIEVRVTQNGTTGWAIIAIAGIVLIGSTSWRIRQVSREKDQPLPNSALRVHALASIPSSQIGSSNSDAEIGS